MKVDACNLVEPDISPMKLLEAVMVTYSYSLACPEKCAVCKTSNKCFDCFTPFALKHDAASNQGVCVDYCGKELYKDTSSAPWTCKNCDFRCLACTGPSNTQCLECDLSKAGVVNRGSECVCSEKHNTDFSNEVCSPLPCRDPVYTDYQCLENYFFNRFTLECSKCHSLCSSCFGPSTEEYLSLIHISEPTRPY
eukprot:TRINITY_DN6548_c0_g1_i1.p1 TRINITY_DN6548_c0_g1~~TRINITY_DN6548_c0_g1_i1.p1  ORF type:complete len:194 (-),score=5.98 TRINITY_DN6548_c0_g1_i1:45-626(-)